MNLTTLETELVAIERQIEATKTELKTLKKIRLNLERAKEEAAKLEK